jgi:hypothetical protein
MTLGGRLVTFFPALWFFLLGGQILRMLQNYQWSDIPILIAIIYLFPLIIHRIHSLIFPLSDGYWILSEKKYNRWWASHMFQYPFIALPWLESILHFFPGLYSCWLRAWGSKIGRGVFWTPRVEIIDRGLVEIGDNVIIGHLVTMCSHMVAEIEERPALIIKKIIIGERSFIGADSQFGPGAVIAPKSKIKVKTRLYWRGEWNES